MGTIVTQARKNGLIVLTAGSDVIRLLPPLTITEEEIERAVSILAECLS
nr:aminotransferase class III-fold pyridoxal phosphate-dependent enzyme [Streptococcus parasuis]